MTSSSVVNSSQLCITLGDHHAPATRLQCHFKTNIINYTPRAHPEIVGMGMMGSGGGVLTGVEEQGPWWKLTQSAPTSRKLNIFAYIPNSHFCVHFAN